MEKSANELGDNNSILKHIHKQLSTSVEKIMSGNLLVKDAAILSYVTEDNITQMNGELKAAINANCLGYIEHKHFFQLPSDLKKKPNDTLSDAQFFAVLIANAECFGPLTDERSLFLGMMRAVYFCMGVVPEVNVDVGLGIREVNISEHDMAALHAKFTDPKARQYVMDNFKQAANACILSLCCTQMEFYQRNHHYMKEYDDRYEAFFSSYGLSKEMKLCSPESILHTVTHPLGIARPYLLICKWQSKQLLPAQIVTRLSTYPAGMAKIAIAIKSYEECIRTDHGYIIEKLLNPNHAKLLDAKALIESCPIAFHVNASLYGVDDRRNEIDQFINEANVILEICAPMLRHLRPHSSLCKSPGMIRAAIESRHKDIEKFLTNARTQKLEILNRSDPVQALGLMINVDQEQTMKQVRKLESEQKQDRILEQRQALEQSMSLIGQMNIVQGQTNSSQMGKQQNVKNQLSNQ